MNLLSVLGRGSLVFLNKKIYMIDRSELAILKKHMGRLTVFARRLN